MAVSVRYTEAKTDTPGVQALADTVVSRLLALDPPFDRCCPGRITVSPRDESTFRTGVLLYQVHVYLEHLGTVLGPDSKMQVATEMLAQLETERRLASPIAEGLALIEETLHQVDRSAKTHSAAHEIEEAQTLALLFLLKLPESPYCLTPGEAPTVLAPHLNTLLAECLRDGKARVLETLGGPVLVIQ